MASGRRQVDPGIWNKAWHRKLAVKHKLLWKYICDHCDWAGVWEPDFDLAAFMIGDDIESTDLNVFGDRIQQLANGKYWIAGFIDFQQPNGLNPKNNAHAPILRSIEKNGIPYQAPNEGLKQGLKQPPCKVTSSKVTSSNVEEGGAGETMAPETLPEYVAAFRAIHPDFGKLPEFGITNAFQSAPSGTWAGAFADFQRDMANTLERPTNPIKLFAGYLRRAHNASGVIIDPKMEEAMQ